MITKILYIIILSGGAFYGMYYLYGEISKESLTVTGNIQVSQQLLFDDEVKQTDSPTYMAVVKGSVKNNTDEHLKNVFIKYNIAGQNTSATIFDLQPGEQVEFNTRGVKTGISSPDFYFDGVQYDEAKL